MPVPEEWFEHRRGDGERLGWMRAESDGFVVIDLLGREVTGPLDWLDAEEFLEHRGIGYLADPFELHLDAGTGTGSDTTGGDWVRVRLTEVATDHITVKKEDGGDMTAPLVEYRVGFPLPRNLRPLHPLP